MSFQSSYEKMEKDELMFINELGWLAAIAVVAINVVPSMFL